MIYFILVVPFSTILMNPVRLLMLASFQQNLFGRYKLYECVQQKQEPGTDVKT